jgi:hypothetical protein
MGLRDEPTRIRDLEDNNMEINEILNQVFEGQGLVIPKPVLNEVANSVCAELLGPNRFRAIHASLNETEVAYAIKDSDLDIVKEVGTVAAAFAAGLPSPASIIVGLVVFLVRYRKKRIRLDARQALILRVLSEAKPASLDVATIQSRLPNSAIAGDEIGLILESLKNLRRVDGNLAQLVIEDCGGWTASDV